MNRVYHIGTSAICTASAFVVASDAPGVVRLLAGALWAGIALTAGVVMGVNSR